jgi:hypothetical protein
LRSSSGARGEGEGDAVAAIVHGDVGAGESRNAGGGGRPPPATPPPPPPPLPPSPIVVANMPLTPPAPDALST